MLSALIPLLMVGAVALADPQTPIAPLRIAPAAGGTPIVVTVTGVEEDPVPLTARWNGAETCLADVGCFVSSWLEANSTGNVDHVLALRVPAERAELQKRYADPAIMQRNTTRFNAVRKWSLLGWVEYGDVRVVLLAKEDSS
jgi:hypothetical protein